MRYRGLALLALLLLVQLALTQGDLLRQVAGHLVDVVEGAGEAGGLPPAGRLAQAA